MPGYMASMHESYIIGLEAQDGLSETSLNDTFAIQPPSEASQSLLRSYAYGSIVVVTCSSISPIACSNCCIYSIIQILTHSVTLHS